MIKSSSPYHPQQKTPNILLNISGVFCKNVSSRIGIASELFCVVLVVTIYNLYAMYP